jgi:hypothetical protein
MNHFPFKPEMLAYDTSLRWPMVQQFHPEAATATYSLAGFITKGGDAIAVRGAQKVLQRPLKVGVGMAFESRPIQHELKEKILRLANDLGYFGVFEAEFIHLKESNRYLLMDFNPRFYGQMGFEMQRGLPLTQLVYAAARGDEDQVKTLIKTAEHWDHDEIHKYRFGWMLHVVLTTQWLGRKLGYQVRQSWLTWAREGRVYDPVFDEDDTKPYYVDILRSILDFARHPRSSFRNYFL